MQKEKIEEDKESLSAENELIKLADLINNPLIPIENSAETKQLAKITQALFAVNIVSNPTEKYSKAGHQSEEEKIIEQDVSQPKNSPTLIETFKEDASVLLQINSGKLSDSPDAKQEPLYEVFKKEDKTKNLMWKLCEQEYKLLSDKSDTFGEQFSFQREPIKKSLLELPKPTEMVALKMFRRILKYSKDIPGKLKIKATYFSKILGGVFEEANPKIKDELIFQLYKQTFKNPEAASSCRVWKLLAMILGFVLPTAKPLFDALKVYLIQSYEKEVIEKSRKNIRYAYNRLIRAYPRGERLFLPTQAELFYLKKYKSYPVQVRLINQINSHFACHTYTTCSDLKKAAMKFFALSYDFLPYYHIYECIETLDTRTERLLKDSEKVLDTLTSWVHESPTRVDAAGIKDYFLLLKVTFHTKINPKYVNTVNFHFIQFDYYYMKSILSLEYTDVITIGALKAQILFGNYTSSKTQFPVLEAKINEIVPKNVLLEMKEVKLVPRIGKLWKKLNGYKMLDCKLAILDHVEKAKKLLYTNRFICTTDCTEYESFEKNSDIKLPENIILIIKPQQMVLCDAQSEAEIDTISLKTILSWGHDETGISLNISQRVTELNLTFDTEQGEYIDFLLKGYTRILANKEIGVIFGGNGEKEAIPYSIRTAGIRIAKEKSSREIKFSIL